MTRDTLNCRVDDALRLLVDDALLSPPDGDLSLECSIMEEDGRSFGSMRAACVVEETEAGANIRIRGIIAVATLACC
jgi:hypothetical protein